MYLQGLTLKTNDNWWYSKVRLFNHTLGFTIPSTYIMALINKVGASILLLTFIDMLQLHAYHHDYNLPPIS